MVYQTPQNMSPLGCAVTLDVNDKGEPARRSKCN